MKIRMKNVLWTVVGIIAAIVIIGGAICLIDGRSPQAIIVAHSFSKLTMEDYEQVKGEKTDKSTVEIPEEVEFPREMRQYRVGGMQVFHMEPQDASKPIVLYIHGGAYLRNFSALHWAAMAEWACMVMHLRFSMPGVAGLRITMLPAGSWKASTPTFLAKSSRNCWIFSTCPEGRGTCVSA